jgi:hypothetical protein
MYHLKIQLGRQAVRRCRSIATAKYELSKLRKEGGKVNEKDKTGYQAFDHP